MASHQATSKKFWIPLLAIFQILVSAYIQPEPPDRLNLSPLPPPTSTRTRTEPAGSPKKTSNMDRLGANDSESTPFVGPVFGVLPFRSKAPSSNATNNGQNSHPTFEISGALAFRGKAPPADDPIIEDTAADTPKDVSSSTPATTNPVFIINRMPASMPFEGLTSNVQQKIRFLLETFIIYWNILSPASLFPGRYHPNPDTCNWGVTLLSAPNVLAELTRTRFRDEACRLVVEHVKRRNGVDPRTEEHNITPSMIIKGDFVIRLEDVVHAIYRMRCRIQEEYPDYPEFLAKSNHLLHDFSNGNS